MARPYPGDAAGQARALASLSQRRPSSLPDLPTIAEAGFPDFNLGSWMGIFVRAGTPPEIARRLESEVLRAIDSVDVKERLARLGLDPAPLPASDFTPFIAQEVGNWRDIVVFICAVLFTIIWWNVSHSRSNWLVMFIVMIILSVVAAIYAGRGIARAIGNFLHRNDHPKATDAPAQ